MTRKPSQNNNIESEYKSRIFELEQRLILQDSALSELRKKINELESANINKKELLEWKQIELASLKGKI